MENEVLQENQENIVESQETMPDANESILDNGETVEETAPVTDNSETLSILSQMVAEYMDNQSLSEEMENIEVRQLELDPEEPSDNSSEILKDLFSFDENGYLLVATEKRDLFTLPIEEYSVEEGLLLLIFIVIFASAIFKAMKSLVFFRKGM